MLVNGRMSERSFRRWRRLPRHVGALLGRFDLCLAQSRGRRRAPGPRSARRASAWPAISSSTCRRRRPIARALAQLRRARRRAAGLDRGEHPSGRGRADRRRRTAALRQRFPACSPSSRRATRSAAQAIAAIADGAGLRAVAALARARCPTAATDVYVADTIGELGLFYRLAPIVFMGGSLVPHGGQNPIEPAKLGAAILHGPHVHNFVDVYAALDARGRRRCGRPTPSTLAARARRDCSPTPAGACARWRRRRADDGRRLAGALRPHAAARSSPSSSSMQTGRGADARARLLVARAGHRGRALLRRWRRSTARSRRGACAGRARAPASR